MVICLFVYNSFRIAAQTMTNKSRLVRNTALYFKLYKPFQIHSVQSENLWIRSIAPVLLLMYIFWTVRDLTVENETTCGNCQISSL
jgi:hypothetical protein